MKQNNTKSKIVLGIILINNNLDKMYMDKLQGIILEDDYIRVSQKFIFDRTKLIKQKEAVEQE